MSLISSLASMVKPSEDKNVAQFAMYDIMPAGINLSKSLINGLTLQYFPETISIDRNAEYAVKKPIGGSHPIYQWIHGSERTLAIDAIFTADQDIWGQGQQDAVSSVESLAQSVGNFIKNPVTAALSATRGGSPPPQKTHVDVPSAIMWLQSKTYPTYKQKSKVVTPPPKLALHMPNVGIQTFANGTILDDVFYCIMTRCSVKLTSFFKSGAPRVAEVSMSFDEIIQIGNQWGFVSRDTFVYNASSQQTALLNGHDVKVPRGGGYNNTVQYQGQPPGIVNAGMPKGSIPGLNLPGISSSIV